MKYLRPKIKQKMISRKNSNYNKNNFKNFIFKTVGNTDEKHDRGEDDEIMFVVKFS